MIQLPFTVRQPPKTTPKPGILDASWTSKFGKSISTESRLSALLVRLRYSRFRLDPNAVVNCILDPLFAAKIPLSRLHGDMSQQELNLLEFACSNMA